MGNSVSCLQIRWLALPIFKKIIKEVWTKVDQWTHYLIRQNKEEWRKISVLTTFKQLNELEGGATDKDVCEFVFENDVLLELVPSVPRYCPMAEYRVAKMEWRETNSARELSLFAGFDGNMPSYHSGRELRRFKTNPTLINHLDASEFNIHVFQAVVPFSLSRY